MKITKFTVVVVFITSTLFSFAQIEGDALFEFDQVVKIELNFNQVDYWDSLETNYESSTYMKADLILTDLSGEHAFSDVGVRLKGNSTYNHPNDKKSLKIDFNKYVNGQDYDGLKKLNFNNGFKDPSLMREKIFFDLCKEVGTPAPRANFANVYMNGELKGFYSMVEQIDDQFLDWKIGDDDGNLFKAGANFTQGPPGGGGTDLAANLVYYGVAQSNYEERYELKTNEDLNNWTDLIDFMNFINTSSDADFESELENRLELDEYMRSVALDMLFSNLDSYTGSARNWYIYHNETTQKWQWIKWDANETFGSYAQGVDVINMPIDYHETERPLLERMFDSPVLFEAYKAHVCNMTELFFNNTYLDPKIDGYYELIKEHVYADNNKQYTNANFDAIINSNISSGGGGPMGGGTTYGLKPFITNRLAYVESQLDCSVYAALDENSLSDISLYPNPATTEFTIENIGDKVVEITIIDQLGNIVMKSNSSSIINISELSKGVYTVKINALYSNNQITRRLVKH